MNIMGFFHPENNVGLEIFAVGTVAMTIFMTGLLIWCWYSNRKWEKKQQEKMKIERRL